MIRILDPTLRGASAAAQPRAPRPAALAGSTLGLLANGKSNGMALLDRIAGHLQARHGVRAVVRVAKTDASAPIPAEDAERVLAAMRGQPLGRAAAIVGTIVADHPGAVVLRSRVGGQRVVTLLAGEQLPRIC